MATPWSVPRLWEGRTVAVLASGPSMSQAVADSVNWLPAIVINETFRLAPWADMLYSADCAWWSARPEALKFKGLKVTGQATCGLPLHSLKITGMDGYDPDPAHLRSGGNGGYAGIHIAAQGGASRILLFGFDMKGGHWHADHEEPLRNPNDHAFGVWMKRFQKLAEALRDKVEILNCTPGSALRCFPFSGLGDIHG